MAFTLRRLDIEDGVVVRVTVVDGDDTLEVDPVNSKFMNMAFITDAQKSAAESFISGLGTLATLVDSPPYEITDTVNYNRAVRGAVIEETYIY